MDTVSDAPLDDVSQEQAPSGRFLPVDRFAIGTAIVSFLLGTILLLYFLISRNEELIGIGMGYVAVAILVNGILFIGLLFSMLALDGSKRHRLMAMGILLINLPIAFSYFLLVINSANF